MKVKDLKKIIEKLPDDMPVASLDHQGSYENAVAYIDGTGEEDEFPMEWLVVAVRDEGGNGMKDKEWLKKELMNLYPSHNEIYEHPDYITVEKVDLINNFIDLINQLDEPKGIELSEPSAWKTIAKLYHPNEVYWGNVRDSYIESLDEPEKVVVPQFVADWIDAHNLPENNPLTEYRDLENDFNEGWTDEEGATVYHWVNKNPYTFIDALRYGYKVENEPHYYVAFEDFNLLYVTYIDIYGENGKFNYTAVANKNRAIKFTDKSRAKYLADFLGAIVVEVTE